LDVYARGFETTGESQFDTALPVNHFHSRDFPGKLANIRPE